MTGAGEATRAARGQPLLVLVAVLGGWSALRVALWQSPFPPVLPARMLAAVHRSEATALATAASRARAAARLSLRRVKRPAALGPLDASDSAPPPPLSALAASSLSTPVIQARQLVGQQLLLAAALSRLKLPPQIASYFSASKAGARPALASANLQTHRPLVRPSRWSADGWLLLRRDSSGPLTAGEPSYGRSQDGAVLRYRLAPTSGHRPVVYARTTRALAGPTETEVAVGVAARPLKGLPVSIEGEVRAYDGPAGREVRPAAFAVTELPTAKLPLGLRGEAYAQAGYVGGRFATAFVDGQARLDAKLARLGRTLALLTGAGVWGGAQKHTARLDVGPIAAVRFRVGDALSRIAVDYRWRVAGNAHPNNGPALTISAGF